MHLTHHGIKGQKWGIRRYQNEDGSLTPAGKIRYGVKSYEIDANSELKRISGIDFNNLDGPLYVSRGKNDYIQYAKIVDNLPSVYLSKNQKKVKVLDLRTNKNIKVANGRAMADYVLNKYGDKYYVDPEESEWYNDIFFDNPSKNPFPKPVTYSEQYNRLMTNKNEEYHGHHGQLGADLLVYNLSYDNIIPGTKQYNEMIKTFKDKGYDAIIDPEDYFGVKDNEKIFKEPLIILDPDKTIRKVGEQFVSKNELVNYFDAKES